MNPDDSDEALIPGSSRENRGRTLKRVYAALDGKGTAEILEPDEAAIFADLLAEREMQGTYTTPEREAFIARMKAEGGYVGEDEQGRLVRTLPGGGVEFIDPVRRQP